MFFVRTRKTGRTVFAAALMSVLFAVTSFAATGRINFSDPTVGVGDEVNVTMRIAADDGAVLSNANVVLKYPSDQLEFISGTDADGGAGAIRVHGTSNGGGTGQLEYNLRFKTAAAGQFNIVIDSYEVYDADDQPIEFTHLGNSMVTVQAQAEASTNCDLNSLEVYPGVLTPAFDQNVESYTTEVGSSVEKLTINAITADAAANVRILGNENLELGENTVTVRVIAGDGTTSRDYVITVQKTESGPEETIQPTVPDVIEGVQLSSKGKTITIMNPTEDVVIPEGFRQGTIKIDDQKVQGWVWGADEEPQYCVVYGMNDKGELNFYRYDMVEKTIQRYFSDPLAKDAVSSREYGELMNEKTAAERTGEIRFLIICILAVVVFLLAMVVIYLISRLRSRSRSERYESTRGRTGSFGERNRFQREEPKAGPEAGEETVRTEYPAEDTREFLKHDFEPAHEDETNSEGLDETQVIRRPERRRRAKRQILPQEGEAKETPETENPEEGIEDLDI